jgi:tetratricopeptide (TPR) repeat protein
LGRKHSRARQHICLCFTILIFLLTFGCTIVKEIQKRQLAQERIELSLKSLEKADCKRSVEELQKVQSMYPKDPPGDEALFYLALVTMYCEDHDENAITYLEQLINEYPQSPLLLLAKEEKDRISVTKNLKEEKNNLNGQIDKIKIELNETKDKYEEILDVIEKAKQVDIEIEEMKRELKR